MNTVVTSSKNAVSSAEQALALLETHKKRMEQLRSRQTRVQVQLEAARAAHAEAVALCEQSYGTADLSRLREMLAAKVAQNNEVVQSFVKALDDFEGHLVRIERALADPVALEELLQSMPHQEQGEFATEASGLSEVEFDEDDI